MIRTITENWGAKLLSLAVAILLWVALVGEQELSTAVDVPVEYRNFPKSLEVSSGMINDVNLLLRAPSGKLRGSTLEDIAVILDLNDVTKAGERTFNLDEKSIHLPSGLVLERAMPTQIRMRFEDRYARDIPVQIRYNSSPTPGYRIARQEVHPDHLRVVGPRSRVERLLTIYTDPIELTGLTGEFESRMNTFIEDPQLRIDGESSVRVRIVAERVRENLEQ